jgi:hypothetical protein
MAGWDDQIFGNLPGSPRRPKPPPDQRSLMQTMFPVDPREVIGGLVNQATEGAGNLTAGAARQVGLPNPDLLGHDVTGFLQSPTFGGGASPMAGATTLAAAPLAARALRGARTAEEIATGARTAATESDAATQAARAAQASPGQTALDQMMSQSQAAQPAAKTGITAYHGSPYSFDRFDISKLGEGEGSNAFGQGLYFAENEDVAKSYRDQLAESKFYYGGNEELAGPRKNAAQILNDNGGDRDKALAFLNSVRQSPRADQSWLDKTEASIMSMDTSKIENRLDPGHMYQVNINADPEHFLDWDKSFAEQSPEVQFAVENLWLKKGNDLEGDLPPFVRSEGRNTGQFIHNAIDAAYPLQGASSALQSEGVPGIKYLDQGSRGGGDAPTHNYVTFSDDMIDILRKYGLAGALAPVGAGAATLSVLGQPGSGTTINSPSPNQQFY